MSRIESKANQYIPILLFLLIAISSLFCIFTFSEGINPYDLHDFIEGMFWADASLKTHSVINPDYVYYYIVPFGSNIIMSPFVKAFGVSFLANQLGMIVFFILYSLTLYRLSKRFFNDFSKRLLFCSIVSMFVYTYIGDNMFHHLLCYGIGFVCFMGELSCVFDIRNHQKVLLNSVLLVFFCLWGSANGIATAALCNIPVLFGILYQMHHNKSHFDNDCIKILLCISLSTAAGLLIYRYYDSISLSLNQYDRRFILANVSDAVSNLNHDLFSDYLKLFYFDPQDTQLFSVKGFLMIMRLIFALSVIAVPFYIRRVNAKQIDSDIISNQSLQLLLSSSIFVMLISVSQFVLIETSKGRYLFNGILSLLLIDAFFLSKETEKKHHAFSLMLLLLMVTVFSAKSILYSYPNGEQAKERNIQLNNILNQENLSYGYVLDRNYKVIELISKGKNTNSVVAYDQQEGLLYVDYDRIYLNETKKPTDIKCFYVLKNNTKKYKFDSLLEEICSKKIIINNDAIYVFNIENWDRIMMER